MATPMDEKIVKLTLQDSGFKEKAAGASSVLDKLSSAIQKLGGSKVNGSSIGIDSIGKASTSAVSGVTQLGSAVENIKASWGVLETIATGALIKIGSVAAEKGLQILNDLTIGPVMSGFTEYEEKMNAIQVTKANTMGKNSMEEIEAALDSLNVYADKTIYNFKDMTSSLGTFTAAGVDLKVAEKAIKGIGNLAATSGASTQQMGTAMYQLSQAMSQGYVGLQDWNSVQNASMNTERFRQVLEETAVEMGHGRDMSKTFRESLKDQWLTTEVLTTSLEKYTDESTELGQMATEAATKVRTFSQLMDTLAEGVGSGWATTWEIIFGGFEDSATLFTNIYNALNPLIDGFTNLRNNAIIAFKEAGGISAIFNSVANVFNFIKNIGIAIMEAYTGVTTLASSVGKIPSLLAIPFKALESITGALANFKLIPQVIGKAFSILFGIMGPIANTIIGIVDLTVALVTNMGGLFDKLKQGVSDIGLEGLLAPVGILANWIKSISFTPIVNSIEHMSHLLTAVANSIKILSLKPLTEWFKGWGELFKHWTADFKSIDVDAIFQSIADSFNSVKEKILGIDLFGPIGKSFDTAMNYVKDKLNGFGLEGLSSMFESAASAIKSAATTIKDVLKNIFVIPGLDTLSNVIEGVSNSFKGIRNIDIGTKVADGFSTITGKAKEAGESAKASGERFKEFARNAGENIVDGFKFAFQVIREFFTGVWEGLTKAGGFIGEVAQSIGNVFGKLKETFGGLFTFDNLMKGGKLAALFSAIKMMNNFDKGLSGIFSSFKELIEGANVLPDFMNMLGDAFKGFKQKFSAKDILIIAAAIAVLALSLKLLSTINMDEIAPTLITFGAAMAGLFGVVKAMSKTALDSKQMLTTSISLILIGAAVGALAKALKKMSAIPLNEMMVALGALITIFGLFAGLSWVASKTQSNIKVATKGMVAMASALFIVTKAVSELSAIPVFSLIKGLLAAIVVMGALAGTMKIIDKVRIKASTAVAMIGLAVGIRVLTKAVQSLGDMNVLGLTKGLGSLAVVMAILAIAVKALDEKQAIASSFALLLISTAIMGLLVPLQILGRTPFGTLLQGLTALSYLMLIMSTSLLVMGKASKKTLSSAVSFSILAGALTVLMIPLTILGKMKFGTLMQGLLGLTVILAELSVAMIVLGEAGMQSLAGAAAMLVVAAALTALSIPISILGAMSLGSLLKGVLSLSVMLAALTASLVVLGNSGAGTAIGAASLIMLAGALTVLMVPMMVYGMMKWETIAKGLVAMGAGLAILLAAGALAQMVAPGLAILSTSLLALSAAVGAVGLTFMVFMIALKVFADTSTDTITKVFELLGVALDQIAALIPKAVNIIISFVSAMIEGLVSMIPQIAEAGLQLVVGLLQAIDEHIVDIVDIGVSIVVKLAEAIIDNINTLVDAGVKMIISFFEGLANAVRGNADGILHAIGSVVEAILEVVIKGLVAIVDTIFGWIPGVGSATEGLGDKAIEGLRSVFNVNTGEEAADEGTKGYVEGIDKAAPEAKASAENVSSGVLEGLKGKYDQAKEAGNLTGASNIEGLLQHVTGANTAGTAVSDAQIEGMMAKIEEANAAGVTLTDEEIAGMMSNQTDFNAAGDLLGGESVTGILSNTTDANTAGTNLGGEMVTGVASKGGAANTAGVGLGNQANAGANSVSGESSGENFGKGYARGIGSSSVGAAVGAAAAAIAKKALDTVNATQQSQSPSRLTTKSGIWFGQGYNNGIVGMTDTIVQSAKALALGATEALESNIIDLNGVIYQNLDTTPVVTPVISTDPVKMDTISKTTTMFENHKVQGTMSFEDEILDRFSTFKEDVTNSFDTAVDRMSNRAIVVENSMDKKAIGTMVAKPVSDEQNRYEQIINRIQGKV